jgi:hypothetical protein
MSPKDVMQKLGHELIYADTDSVFIKKSNGIYRSVWKTRIPHFLFSKSKLDKCLDLGKAPVLSSNSKPYIIKNLDTI